MSKKIQELGLVAQAVDLILRSDVEVARKMHNIYHVLASQTDSTQQPTLKRNLAQIAEQNTKLLPQLLSLVQSGAAQVQLKADESRRVYEESSANLERELAEKKKQERR